MLERLSFKLQHKIYICPCAPADVVKGGGECPCGNLGRSHALQARHCSAAAGGGCRLDSSRRASTAQQFKGIHCLPLQNLHISHFCALATCAQTIGPDKHICQDAFCLEQALHV